MLHKTEKFLLRFLDPLCYESQKSKSISSYNLNKIFVNPNLSPSGLVYRYSNIDLNKISDLNLDVLVRCGSGILRGEILKICKYGVISFHHGDNSEFRGFPAGFWETYYRKNKTGFIIQQLTNELDGGNVLFKGAIRTKLLYLINQSNIYYKSAPFMDKFLKNLSLNNALPLPLQKLPYSNSLFSTPNFFVQCRYLIKTFISIAKKFMQRVFRIGQIWSIAYQETNEWKDIIFWKSNIIKNIEGHYFADPFVFFKNNKHYIFVEDYDLKAAKGSISVLEIYKNKYRYFANALTENFHLSYPFLLEVENTLFMIPECNEANEIRIYKCDKFPMEWSLHKVLIKNVKAVDTMIFKFEDKWWMLTNIDSSDMVEHESELHLFYSDSFDSDNWISHPKNPIIFSPDNGRNGGLINDKKGNIFRVFQNQSMFTYGRKMGIAKIKKLTIKEYQEEEIVKINPKFFKKINGCHTFNHKNGLSVFDISKIERY